MLFYSATLWEECKIDLLTCSSSTCIHRINDASSPALCPIPVPKSVNSSWITPICPPHSTCCIGIGSQGYAHWVAHMSIDMAVVGPGQEVYMCTCPRFHLLYVLPPHLSIQVCTQPQNCLLTPSFITSFLHPLPILPHSYMPMHCHLCSHLLIQVCTFVCACAALVCVCVCAHPLLLYCHS